MGKRTQLAKGAIVFPNGTIQLIVMPNPPGEMSEGSLVNKIGVFARATNPVTAKTTISAASLLRSQKHFEYSWSFGSLVLYLAERNVVKPDRTRIQRTCIHYRTRGLCWCLQADLIALPLGPGFNGADVLFY